VLRGVASSQPEWQESSKRYRSGHSRGSTTIRSLPESKVLFEPVWKDLPQRLQNRYSVTRIVLTEPALDRSADYAPVNVFTIDHETYSPLLLEVLSAMAFRSEVKRLGLVAEELNIPKIAVMLRASGYGDPQILEGLALAFRHDNRLMYSTVADHHKITSEGLDGYRLKDSVFLSWAGFRYANELVRNTSYIQWGLLRVPKLLVECSIPDHELHSVGVIDADETSEGENLFNQDDRLAPAMKNLVKLVGWTSDWRLARPLRFFPGENGEKPELIEYYGMHKLPEVNILMRTAGDISGILHYRSSGGFGRAKSEELWEVRRELLALVTRVLDSARDVVGHNLPTWTKLSSVARTGIKR
jgi:hypothetical protein